MLEILYGIANICDGTSRHETRLLHDEKLICDDVSIASSWVKLSLPIRLIVLVDFFNFNCFIQIETNNHKSAFAGNNPRRNKKVHFPGKETFLISFFAPSALFTLENRPGNSQQHKKARKSIEIRSVFRFVIEYYSHKNKVCPRVCVRGEVFALLSTSSRMI